MREIAALILLFISLLLIIVIDISDFFISGAFRGALWSRLGFFESLIDASAVILIYVIMRKEIRVQSAMRKELSKANAVKSRVVNMAAHDLRNPVGVIKGYAELILDDDKLSPQSRELSRRIHSKADELLNLVRDLLESSTVEEGGIKIEKRAFPLKSLLADVTEEFRPTAEKKAQVIEWDCEQNIQAFADFHRLKQVLTNLLSNAIKYSPKGSAIRVEVEPKDGRVQLCVCDQGPGLEPHEIGHVFDKFSEVKKNTTGGESSHGLGLSLAKTIVDLHGGRLWVESEGRGRGSRFWLELPSET